MNLAGRYTGFVIIGLTSMIVSGFGNEKETVRDAHELLNLTLWIQYAPEYVGLSRQIFVAAENAMNRALADPSWTAALEQDADCSDLPPALIMDLDETVFDNNAFFGEVIQRGEELPTGWKEWIDRAEAIAVPGAVEFITEAQKRGVRVFFITNRHVRGQDATIANLEKLGITAGDEDLLMGGENGWRSDKTERRRAVARDYRVILLLGDSLNDFVLPAPESLEAARKEGFHYADFWGRKWFIFPNPANGSWMRPITSGGTTPDERLERKRSAVKGFGGN